ncbi:hypothetical protein [Citrobacter phage CVT22]|uniref:Uncharacterized protein n=1 Tax=Citrobacter phage CVT22 TaxID=1622234 RepID=A0A0R6CRI3_9CAUD|nr:hypothetical protein APL39_gp77 [Citrobacter phage CVT22]AJT60780.1 hypothetical protein [Citrobacter phage CVT22]
MPRPVPEYKWSFTNSAKLKGEQGSHTMKGKVKGKSFKQAKPPVSLPKTSSQFAKDVHYGSSYALLNALQKL